MLGQNYLKLIQTDNSQMTDLQIYSGQTLRNVLLYKIVGNLSNDHKLVVKTIIGVLLLELNALIFCSALFAVVQL